MVVGHQLIDMYTRYPFYVRLFTNAGFSTSLGGVAPDGLIDNMDISGDVGMVTAWFSKILASGLDEHMVTLLPIKDAGDVESRLLHSIGDAG